jgi:hypothetical protein
MAEVFDVPTIEPGKYEHYKGKQYEVIGTGCQTEMLEYLVVYKPLYEHDGQPDIWLRPYAMFIEDVEVGGKRIPRFKKLS